MSLHFPYTPELSSVVAVCLLVLLVLVALYRLTRLILQVVIGLPSDELEVEFPLGEVEGSRAVLRLTTPEPVPVIRKVEVSERKRENVQ